MILGRPVFIFFLHLQLVSSMLMKEKNFFFSNEFLSVYSQFALKIAVVLIYQYFAKLFNRKFWIFVATWETLLNVSHSQKIFAKSSENFYFCKLFVAILRALILSVCSVIVKTTFKRFWKISRPGQRCSTHFSNAAACAAYIFGVSLPLVLKIIIFLTCLSLAVHILRA